MPLEKVPSQPESDTIPGNIMIFNHPDDKNAWIKIAPESLDDPTDQDQKSYINLENWIKEQFAGAERLLKNLKFIKRCLVGRSEYEAEEVSVRKFVWLTRCFGPFSRTPEGNSCFFLKQVDILASYTLKAHTTFISPFAGIMTMEEAEERLKKDTVQTESYLVRFSESLADKGGFSLAVKANAMDVHHYNIVGEPERFMEDPRYFNARLKLVHHNSPRLNEDEDPYRDIVHFMKERLKDEIEDGVYCTNICPDLPNNVLFRGYR